MPGKTGRRNLIKPGTPLPGYPSYKFKSAHLKKEECEKAEDKILENPKIAATRKIIVPRQYLIFAKRERGQSSRFSGPRPRERRL
jgi:hypothetical protein